MPRELHNAEQFQRLIPKALELRVFREGESVKLKLRTPDYLYTFKTNQDEADGLIKGAKDLEVIEISPKKEKESKEDKKTD
ncbi:MAG: hypothetical protein JRN20_03645 [Nitrososphaerota archaeon]|nr:hypothetical protein [Nitrososphaerota archaeon]MDG6924126.1 hypothetical protein [Nitrososphaerota archaeon]